MQLFLALALDAMRSVLLVRHAPELRKELQEELGEEYAAIEKIASSKESKLTHQTLKRFLDASARMRFSPIPALSLELAVLEGG
jgi:ABC-type protease/lipase transport system fused ATPase/permease subunit